MKPNKILILILLLAGLIRLWGFDHHFVVASDQARDLLVARGAIELREIPWVGSFSSAGPFVFGPNWYWFLIGSTVIFPFFLGPWVAMVLISLAFVWVMYLIGKAIAGRKLGLITALIAAISPAAIGLSSYLTQHAMVEIFAGLCLLGLVLFTRQAKLRYVFLFGLGVGGATSFHYQGFYLLAFAPMFFLMVGFHFKRLILVALTLAAGFWLPLLSLVGWDATRNFQNSLHLLGYFQVGQYQFYVPNRWLTYLGVFWPEFLGKIFGGSFVFGWIAGIAIIAAFGRMIKKRIFNRTLIYLLAGFLVQVIMLRYFRGERYDGYLVYLHPTVIAIAGWSLYQLSKIHNVVAVVLFGILSLGSLVAGVSHMGWDNGISSINTLTESLKAQYPNEKFTLYGRTLNASNCAFTTSLVLDREGVNSDHGRNIGLCLGTVERCNEPNSVKIAQADFQNDVCVLVDLDASPKENLTKKNNWYPFSRQAVFDDVQNWWKK